MMKAIITREILKDSTHFLINEGVVTSKISFQEVFDVMVEVSDYLNDIGESAEEPKVSEIGDIVQFYQYEKLIAQLRGLGLVWYPTYVNFLTRINFEKALKCGKEVVICVGDTETGSIWDAYKGFLQIASTGLPRLVVKTLNEEMFVPFGYVLQMTDVESGEVLHEVVTDLERKFEKLMH